MSSDDEAAKAPQTLTAKSLDGRAINVNEVSSTRTTRETVAVDTVAVTARTQWLQQRSLPNFGSNLHNDSLYKRVVLVSAFLKQGLSY